MELALGFINTLLRNMESEAHAEAAVAPEGAVFEGVYPKIEIVGDRSGILIGHHGETLDAIQFLANLCVNRKTGTSGKDFVKITVDIENYREKREATLRALARRMAQKAIKYKRNMVLEPMNPYERRIIHSELQTFENVDTHSVGSDENRKVVITYEGADKAEQKRSQRTAAIPHQSRAARRRKAQNPLPVRRIVRRGVREDSGNLCGLPGGKGGSASVRAALPRSTRYSVPTTSPTSLSDSESRSNSGDEREEKIDAGLLFDPSDPKLRAIKRKTHDLNTEYDVITPRLKAKPNGARKFSEKFSENSARAVSFRDRSSSTTASTRRWGKASTSETSI